jgi:hypothetical protein
MHIYNWYHSNIPDIHYIHEHRLQYTWHIPLAFSPLADSPLLLFLTPFFLLGTLLAVTGSVHLDLRLLVNWPPLSQPFPQTLPPPNSQNPDYPRLTKTTLRRIQHLLSGTGRNILGLWADRLEKNIHHWLEQRAVPLSIYWNWEITDWRRTLIVKIRELISRNCSG